MAKTQYSKWQYYLHLLIIAVILTAGLTIVLHFFNIHLHQSLKILFITLLTIFVLAIPADFIAHTIGWALGWKD